MDVVLSTLWSVAALQETIKENIHNFNINKTISKNSCSSGAVKERCIPQARVEQSTMCFELVFSSPRLVAKLDKIIEIHVKMSKVLFDDASKLALYF